MMNTSMGLKNLKRWSTVRSAAVWGVGPAIVKMGRIGNKSKQLLTRPGAMVCLWTGISGGKVVIPRYL